MTTFKNKLCVLTGGSSGIGLSIAEDLARQGARLLLIARDPAKLERVASDLRARGAQEVAVLSADVSRAEDCARIAPAIAELGAAADLVINSAGVVSAGLLDEVPAEEWQRLFGINVFGLVGVLQAVIPAMRERAQRDGSGGHIVNVASAAGLVGFPGMAAYGATKAAVVALSESLRAELAGYGIGVTAVCPGFVQTPIAETVTLHGRMNTPRMQREIQQWFQRNNLQAETVAAATLRGIRRNQALVVVGRDARAGYWSKRLAPRILSRITAKVGQRTTRAERGSAR